LLVGVGGVVLIAVWVVGRGDAAEVVTWERLTEDGGVLWVHIEVFERQRYPGEGGGLPERYVEELWLQSEPGAEYGQRAISALHSLDGVLFSRTSTGGWGGGNTFPTSGEARNWPSPRNQTIEWTKGFNIGGTTEQELLGRGLTPVPGPREGTVMFVGPYPRPRGGQVPGAGNPGYPIDLKVVSVEEAVVLTETFQPLSIHFRALLEDGSEVVIASQEFEYSNLRPWEWEGIEELVFGE
jgi:hypothetical protein